jgi:serine/threonine-protein kinase
MAAQLQGRIADPAALVDDLLHRALLTAYQAEQLLQGRGHDLLLGPYVILDRLGEGGMGTVFKARHQKLDRMVALKLLRAELLMDPELVRRFYREIEMGSQLRHPNLVHAYDAGPIGVSHVLVMEYLEGTDLARRVKQSGPVSVDQAREYIRQAALGLQCIHDNRLVHRDIKPHNLFLQAHGSQSGGVVKILDLGLARLHRPVHGVDSSTITDSGTMMMGTLDYMAPEQALDFHGADTRADIYSLGCTLYFLLTGRAPFDGTPAQKLLGHQQHAPTPVAQFRTDVPATLDAVLCKMLAKRPEDRFQMPAEVVAALTGDMTAVLSSSLLPTDATAIMPPLAEASPRPDRARSRKHKLAFFTGLAVVLLGIVGLTIWAANSNNLPRSAGSTATARSQRLIPPTTRPTLTDGLVGYWKFDDGQGKLVTDSSPNGNHGVLLGNPRWVAGKSGGALSFAGEGSKDAIEIRRSPSLDITGPMTIAAWVWPETKTGVQSILSRNLGTTQRGYTLRINGEEEGGRMEFIISSDGKREESVTASNPIEAGSWSHWAGVFEPLIALRIYRNGELDASATTNVPRQQFNNKQDLGIARRPGGTHPFRGRIGEVRIYNRALTAAEIRQLAGE